MATMLASYPKHGILLNPSPNSYPSSLPFPSEASPISPYQAICSSFKRNSLQMPAAPTHDAYRHTASPAQSSSSSESTPAGSPRSAPRKIRFAPLPDPRRAVLVTDDGEELPLYSLDSSDGSSESVNETGGWISAPNGRQSPKSGAPAADDGATPLASQSPWSTPATTPAASPYPATSALSPSSGYVDFVPAPSSPFLSKTKKLFKPLFPSKLPEMKLNVSTEEVFTLGTINLFRTSSRDSNATPRASGSRASSRERAQSDNEAVGAPLGRSTSAGSTRAKKGSKGVPFRRTQSYETETGAPLGRTTSNNNGMQGQRMLNGRVYGAKRNQHNPFANIADREPEFVEWGYGGMGSVKAAKDSDAGSMLWAPLQQNVRATVGAAHDDEDDGSGTAWIRKRREQREREAQEKKVREAEAASATPSTASSADASPAGFQAHLPESTSQVSTPKAEDPHHTGESSEYLHTALCLRPPVTRHRSVRSECASKGPSRDGLTTVTEGVSTPAEIPATVSDFDETSTEATSSPSSGSPSDSVEDVSEVDGSEDEAAAADEARVTAKGASVEFISKRRHA